MSRLSSEEKRNKRCSNNAEEGEDGADYTFSFVNKPVKTKSFLVVLSVT